MTLCNNNNQTWFSDTQTSAKPFGAGGGGGGGGAGWGGGGTLKPSPFRLGFQHYPWGPADVNA